MKVATLYEQAITEQLKICIKIEQNFRRIEDLSQMDSPWACEGLVRAVIDILALLNRSDIKAKLSKHLTQLSSELQKHLASPYCDETQIQSLLSHIQDYCRYLLGVKGRLCQVLREDAILHSAQRCLTQPAGSCTYDAPKFHQFLMQPFETRAQHIEHWLAELNPIRAMVTVILHIARENAEFQSKSALNGGFSQSLKAKNECQLVRIKIPNSLNLHPEISVGRHQVNIRFYQPGAKAPTTDSIPFELSTCY